MTTFDEHGNLSSYFHPGMEVPQPFFITAAEVKPGDFWAYLPCYETVKPITGFTSREDARKAGEEKWDKAWRDKMLKLCGY